MKSTTQAILKELVQRYPTLQDTAAQVQDAFSILLQCYVSGGRVYLCGNGGSASDCEHIVGELLKSFRVRRTLSSPFKDALCALGTDGEYLASKLEAGLPAVALTSHPALCTAFANDNTPALVFAQQLSVLADKGDVLLTLSTSGNSQNCVYAALTAKAKGMKTVFLGGGNGGKLLALADVSVIVPEKETYKVQELHLPVYHCLCAMLENELFA